jgi:hypothetical protein
MLQTHVHDLCASADLFLYPFYFSLYFGYSEGAPRHQHSPLSLTLPEGPLSVFKLQQSDEDLFQ